MNDTFLRPGVDSVIVWKRAFFAMDAFFSDLARTIRVDPAE
jgi:hypothetical protein